MKSCTKCGERKPNSSFAIRKDTGKRRAHCRKCVNASNLARYHDKPRSSHQEASYRYIVQQYGITIDDYNRMLEQQQGLCALCRGRPKPGKRLSVDHCHRTGSVRALLCAACNTGLGMFGDDAERLTEALEYIHRHSGKEPWQST